jgi:hypothetical protein
MGVMLSETDVKNSKFSAFASVTEFTINVLVSNTTAFRKTEGKRHLRGL